MMGGDSVSERSMGLKEKRKVKKLVKDVILELIGRGIDQVIKGDKRAVLKPVNPNNVSLFENITCYGLLVNSETKEKDLIIDGRSQSVNDIQLAYYTTVNQKLFTHFPCAANYISPYTGHSKVFLEVISEVGDTYLCKLVDSLRYLELLGKKEDTNG